MNTGGPMHTKKVQGWKLQLSWSESRRSQRGEPVTAGFAREAIIVQGLKEWAQSEARSMVDALIAQRPAGSVFDVQVHGQRHDITLGEYSEEITGLERQSDSFTVEAAMSTDNYQPPTIQEIRQVLGGGTELIPTPPKETTPA